MDIPGLCAELERLFDLEELMELSEEHLGLRPEDVGGESALGSFAKALTNRCVAFDAVEALCDAVAVARSDADQRLLDLRNTGFSPPETLGEGSVLGPYRIEKKLGGGQLSTCYLAHPSEVTSSPADAEDDDLISARYTNITGTDVIGAGNSSGGSVRLRVLKTEATLDRRGLQRFLTASRIIGTIPNRSLPSGVIAGPLGDRVAVVHDFFEGESLAEKIQRDGPMRIDEARPLLRAILEALDAIHAYNMAHGAIRLENVLYTIGPNDLPTVLLLDGGTGYLRSRIGSDGKTDRLRALCMPDTVAPELIEGRIPDARSDVYSFGAMAFHLLSGRPAFKLASSSAALIAHLTREADALSSVAPRGWVGPVIDEFVKQMLDRDPSRRPADAAAVLDIIDRIDHRSMFPPELAISEEDIESRLHSLLEEPLNVEALAGVEAAVDEGADPARVADGIRWVASQLNPAEDPDHLRAQKWMMFRAGMLYEGPARKDDEAEKIYEWIVESDPEDEPAMAALERVRRRLGKHEELIEMLLERRERSESANDRARALGDIGRIYANELKDKSQALVAFAQAFCEDPHEPTYADEIERLAGSSQDAWAEALQSCVEAVQDEAMPTENKNLLFAKMGFWYTDKLGRPDLGLPCFQQVTATEPANDAALEGMAHIYRKAQSWPELGMVLTARAEVAPTPGLARDLRAEAANVLAVYLNDPASAKAMYEQILAEDPSHEDAADALAELYGQFGDHANQVQILERRVNALHGEDRHDLLCRIADLYEHGIDDLDAAAKRVEAVLEEDPTHAEALRVADRIYSKSGRFKPLLDNLEAQLRVTVTPRQKITLYTRIAGIYAEEFLNDEKAAQAYENVLDLEPAHDEALAGLARHYQALERWGDVAIVYEQHIEASASKEQQVALGLALGKVLVEKANASDRAIEAYERVLEADPENSEALEALARLRAIAGDSDQALAAIDALAAKAATPEERATHYVRAAELLLERGHTHLAIERFKLAVDANPADKAAATKLRAAYVSQGDARSAVELLEQDASRAEGDAERGRLYGEMARLCYRELAQDDRAESAAKRAAQHDPSNLDARWVLGDIAINRENYHEAATHYEQVISHREQLPPDAVHGVLDAFIDAAVKSGMTDRAVAVAEDLLQLSPEDPGTLTKVATVVFNHGSAERALALNHDLVHQYGAELDNETRAAALYRLGDAARKTGDGDRARKYLEQAIEINPDATEPIRALAKVYEERGQWQDVMNTLYRLLDCVAGDEYIKLLLEIGDVAAQKLGDAEYAAKNYLSALSERPDDRNVLMKLMRLYSEEKDWWQLLNVILKIADLVPDTSQKAKYMHTAAMLALKEIGEVGRAKELLDEVLKLDPTIQEAVEQSLKLRRQVGDHEGLKELLKTQIKVASDANDRPRMLALMDELSTIYDKNFGRLEQAIAVTEAAVDLDPDDPARRERLARLFASDPRRYLDKAVAAHRDLLRRDPYRPGTYKSMRALYDSVRHQDASWCVCQALHVLNQAAPEESSFYRQGRDGAAPNIGGTLAHEDWLNLLMHPSVDPLLTGIVSLIQSTVMSVRAKPLESFGYSESHLIDPARRMSAVDTLKDASTVLGVKMPPLYQNINDPGSISALHSKTPSLSLGNKALQMYERERSFAFEAGRTLSYYRPGMYVRNVVSSHNELKAWLFAAMKLVAPQFPIAREIAEAVQGAMVALNKGLSAERRSALQKIVAKLLRQGASLELRRWMSGVDLTADRAGLLLSDDLQTAVQQIRLESDDSLVPTSDRVREIVLYSVSPEYFDVRARLGLAVR